MTTAAPRQAVAVKPPQTASTGVFLQRKCACGGRASDLTGECEGCRQKKMVGPQTKLRINEPGNAYEQEADRVAEQILAKPAHPGVSSAPPHIQRLSGPSNGQSHAVPASVDRALASLGKPLEPALRQDMEQRFGYDFSRVRVHSGPAAEQSAQDVDAHAYTVGQDIVFGAGRFTPGTHDGRRLVAHELTHVVQQSVADGIRAGHSDRKRDLCPISQRAIVSRGSTALALFRKPTTVTAHLVGPPPPVHAAEGATPENRQLAEVIDDLEKLSNAELTKRRDEVAVEAVRLTGDDQKASLQTLEAIEFLARRRGLAPIQPDWSYDKRRWRTPLSIRRLNVRAQIERGVGATGSFKKALGSFTHTSEIESDLEFFQAEADRFAREFKGQARLTADRMLDDSQRAIGRILNSYGLPVDSARWAAQRLARGSDVHTEAEHVVKAATMSKDVDAPAREKHRKSLAETVEDLKKHQQTVTKHQQTDAELFKLHRKDPSKFGSADRDLAYKNDKELEAARITLKAAWIKAERPHPILAAYRRGGELEKVDLGRLDTDPVERQMEAVLAHLLPKLADIGKAKYLVRIKHLDPLALPSVVALTRANMFIPEGSIRAGVVNDLAAEATDDDGFIQTLALALALVTLLPSGGGSLAVAAGIGLAAYSAAKAWEQYDTQKTLVNTDLDLARSLSTEEPSLTGFAVSLVSLGLEGIPLIGAFNKARKLKALVRAGEDTRLTVRELNAIGKSHGADGLGERALAEAKVAERRTATLVAEDVAKGAERVHTPAPVGSQTVPLRSASAPRGEEAVGAARPNVGARPFYAKDPKARPEMRQASQQTARSDPNVQRGVKSKATGTTREGSRSDILEEFEAQQGRVTPRERLSEEIGVGERPKVPGSEPLEPKIKGTLGEAKHSGEHHSRLPVQSQKHFSPAELAEQRASLLRGDITLRELIERYPPEGAAQLFFPTARGGGRFIDHAFVEVGGDVVFRESKNYGRFKLGKRELNQLEKDLAFLSHPDFERLRIEWRISGGIDEGTQIFLDNLVRRTEGRFNYILDKPW